MILKWASSCGKPVSKTKNRGWIKKCAYGVFFLIIKKDEIPICWKMDFTRDNGIKWINADSENTVYFSYLWFLYFIQTRKIMHTYLTQKKLSRGMRETYRSWEEHEKERRGHG